MQTSFVDSCDGFNKPSKATFGPDVNPALVEEHYVPRRQQFLESPTPGEPLALSERRTLPSVVDLFNWNICQV